MTDKKPPNDLDDRLTTAKPKGTATKMTPTLAQQIRSRPATSAAQHARELGLSRSTTARVKKGETWRR